MDRDAAWKRDRSRRRRLRRSFMWIGVALVALLPAAGLAQTASVNSPDAQTQPTDAPDAKALPSGQEVVERYMEVVGGRDAITASSSRILTGTFSLPAQGVEGRLVVHAAAPTRACGVRTEAAG